MKKVFSLIVIAIMAIAPLQSMQANKKIALDTIGINIFNSTGSNGSIYVSGPTSFSATLVPYTNSFGPISPGNYTVTLYANVSGSHTYNFYGQSQTNAIGYATFNVNIVYNAFGSIN